METQIIKTEIQGIEANEILQRFENLNTKFDLLLNSIKPSPETTLLTRNEVAKMFGVSLVTIHEWSKKGVLQSYKVGNQVRFKQSEVFEALQAKQTAK